MAKEASNLTVVRSRRLERQRAALKPVKAKPRKERVAKVAEAAPPPAPAPAKAATKTITKRTTKKSTRR